MTPSIRWRQRATNLQDDGIEVLIDQEIESEQFETVGQRHERAELTYTITSSAPVYFGAEKKKRGSTGQLPLKAANVSLTFTLTRSQIVFTA